MTDSQSQAIPQDEFLTIYREMRRIAAIHLRRSPSHPTLQPTMIVHEAYLRLSGYPWKSRTHYLALASRAMRQWIIDYLRAKMAQKRDGAWIRLSLKESAGITVNADVNRILDIDRLLDRLALRGSPQGQCGRNAIFWRPGILRNRRTAEGLAHHRKTRLAILPGLAAQSVHRDARGMKNGFALCELDDIFHEAAALCGPERVAFLDGICRTRPDLFRELLQMLDADAQADPLLDHALPACLGGVQSRDCIGRWRLIEPIGEGGLGVVYRASCEADGVTLQAALKILRAGFDRGAFHRRFIEERNILSGLDHPYIARLIDAGADPGGESFLAVEFVAGQPLDQYLSESSSPLRERLELFMKICEAVEYLHGNGIVHGDIKPSNVMVKPDSTPKLLDFGTARLMARGEQPASELSRLLMTPGYASPEQEAGLGSSMLGDVYSLGCVLRDILALAAPPADVCAIRDRCLSPSPPGRYQSPGEVSDDVRRFLHHFPVRARPASSWYVSARFLRRNRIGCGLAAIAVLSLVIGGLVSRHNARRADHYARQNRSVITHLLQDPPAARSPESSQRAAFAATIHDAIAQMESLTPPPLAELTTAWRRLSYTQAARGEHAAERRKHRALDRIRPALSGRRGHARGTGSAGRESLVCGAAADPSRRSERPREDTLSRLFD